MEILLISLVIISANIIITVVIIDYFMDLILKAFKTEDEYDLQVQKYICDIYDIILHNGLTRPAKKKEEKKWYKWIYKK